MDFEISLWESFDKPNAQIKNPKILLIFVEKFVHNTVINCIFRLNQKNFNSFFFTHRFFKGFYDLYIPAIKSWLDRKSVV